jgi:ATP-dependent HslUV protease ATP-binding subunit HslU
MNQITETERLSEETIANLTPRRIVEELDYYIVGQAKAKRAVAVAMRNRNRRRLLPEDIREEIHPKNIIMIGPTGCGKTEIARRISRLTGAPFIKVEATKYTEVGYVGRDVESMVRDLIAISINMVRKEYREKFETQAKSGVEEKLLDLLLPSSAEAKAERPAAPGLSLTGMQIAAGMQAAAPDEGDEERKRKAREMFREKLKNGELEDREVELEVQGQISPSVQVLSGHNIEEIDMQIQSMLGDLLPKRSKKRRVTIAEARKILLEEELERLLDQEKIQGEAIRRAEELGIIFIDEIDKVCGRGGGSAGPDVSREGVQRDLLPIVEGATVSTRHGPVRTDHILFIAAGAFHNSRPSDLIPELQGRFPIRVELEKLTERDFQEILKGPRVSLTRQAQALLSTEGVEIEFTEDGIVGLAAVAFQVNEKTENIGARRLHTIMEHLLEELSFNAPDLKDSEKRVVVDRAFVEERLRGIVEDRDLSQYIL